jgi:hypothetical protein
MRQLCPLALLLCLALPARATHLLGGTLLSRHLNGLTYEFRAILFFSEGAAQEAQVEMKVCTGDGSEMLLRRVNTEVLSNRVVKGIFVGTYSYAGPGQYRISASMLNRSPMTNVQVPVPDVGAYLYTTLNTSFPNTTALLPDPVFEAGTRQLYSSSLAAATDSEGDSLVYRLTRILQPALKQCGPYQVVDAYQFPNEITREGTFGISQKTLRWNAPTRQGTYVYALVAEEWRRGIKIAESLHERVLFVTAEQVLP